MAEIKLTKNELRAQQNKLNQLQRYLPTLQLKKAMLQSEVNEVRVKINQLEQDYQNAKSKAEACSALLADNIGIDTATLAVVEKVHRHWENIAGVEVPHFEKADFKEVHYSLFETPVWLDGAILILRESVERKLAIQVAEEMKAALERELREVSIRVNLFEKILIPRCQMNIKKIKVFLGDMELAAVSQAKVAKGKIIKRKQAKKEEALRAAGEQCLGKEKAYAY